MLQGVNYTAVNDHIIELSNGSVEQFQKLTEHHAAETLVAVVSVLVVAALLSRAWNTKEPPSLFDPIPYVYNTLQFILDNEKFMKRAKYALSRSNVTKFYQGISPVYLISGPKNVQTIFGKPKNVNNDASMLQIMLPLWYKMPKKDVDRFATDKSGRGHAPLPGTERTPKNKRYFYQHEHVHTEFLSRTQYLTPLVERLYTEFSEILEKYPTDDWTMLSVVDFCKHDATKCAISTLAGPKLFELTPDLLDRFWDFDDVVFSLAMGFPRWLYARPYKAHDRYLDAFKKYLDSAWANFDWDGPSSEAAWEPEFGARVMREVAKWLSVSGFKAPYTGPGAIGILAWASSSNVIPTLTWTLMEVFRDPSLFQALREEVATASITEHSTGSGKLDINKVVSLPLLTSVYTEALRLHMNFNITRNVREPLVMDGYKVGKGITLQAPITVAHYDESVWGAEGHPASEFWAERNIKYVDEKDRAGNVSKKRQFAMTGRTGSYFPYGGGYLICPGRHFAKQEIMIIVALVVSRFDVEFIKYTKLDGSPSERSPQNNARFCGAGAEPPDRDMKVRIRRVA